MAKGKEEANDVRSFYVCERCGETAQQLSEPEACPKCKAMHFVWFQNRNELKEYVARFG